MTVEVEVLRGNGVLLGTQPPCITLPEMAIESIAEVALTREFPCINEAFTAVNDRQVNGINKPIKSASNASKISVFLFLFLFLSISTS